MKNRDIVAAKMYAQHLDKHDISLILHIAAQEIGVIRRIKDLQVLNWVKK